MKDSGNHSREKEQAKNKRKAAAISVIIHAVILILFMFLGLSSAFPPPVEGILVNFGTMETGSSDQPSEVKEQTQEVSPAEASQATSVPETNESPAEVATQNIEETISIKSEEEKEPRKESEKKTEVKPKPVKEEIKPQKEEPAIDMKSLYTGQESDENNPGNEGELYTAGDQGDPEGDPSSKNYEGDSKGLGNIGVGYDLAGRNLLAIPPIDENYKETGKVVVSIKVDRNGKVLFAKYNVKGSTTTDPKLIRLAEQAALQAKFSSNSKAAEEQFGSITFTFKLK